jgi:hypothetical protein
MGGSKSKAQPKAQPIQNPDGPTQSDGMPRGPANFTTYQLPDTSNDISVNMSGLQSCMLTSVGGDLLSNCVANNIKGLSNQSNSYQTVKYVGPGHNLDSWDRITFGSLQNFQNTEQNNDISTNTLTIYIVVVVIYLFIMLK